MTRPLLDADQLAEIARVYDGKTETVDALMKKMKVRRHNILSAARRLGKSRKKEPPWTEADDEYVVEHYGLVPVPEIAKNLGRSEYAVHIRAKRDLKISTCQRADEIGYTIWDLESMGLPDHRIIRRFIDAGELRATELRVRADKVVSRVISIEDMHRFLKRRPEFFDYRHANLTARAALELFNLPDPPRYKAVTCKAQGTPDGTLVRQVTSGPTSNHGEREFKMVRRRRSMSPCSEKPLTFWVPTYEVNPTCPRCGCQVSRFSDRRLYRDDEPDNDAVLKMLAGKLGIRWRNGHFYGVNGDKLAPGEILEYVFTRRAHSRENFRLFQRLLESGLSPIRKRKVAMTGLKRSLMDYTLTPRQARAWQRFLEQGSLGLTWPPGEGKMYFLAYAFSRLPGDHVLFVNTTALAESWVEFLQHHAKHGAVHRRSWKPKHDVVELLESNGSVRCTLSIYTYATRHGFHDEKFVLTGYDEAHFLPGNNAHRLALIDTKYRIGTTASPNREDGRARFLDVLVGETADERWADILEARGTPPPPFKVLVVEDVPAKLDVLRRVFDRRRRGLIFVERLVDGEAIGAELDIPFVSSATKTKLKILTESRQAVVSRVADHGLDLTDLRFIIEFGFFRGSRMQQLQRYGRLMHSKIRSNYLLLMTRKELSLYYKRLTALEERGIRFAIEIDLPGADTRQLIREVRTGKKEQPATRDPRLDKLQKALGRGKRKTLADLARAMFDRDDMNTRSLVWRLLMALKAEGKVKKAGKGKSSRGRRAAPDLWEAA